ncbi:unnamed protein product [Victoria cruziana]
MVRELEPVSFYNRLRESTSLSSSSPLLIFPSTSDVDSLCALKVITHVLSSDSIRYSCYPISSFAEVDRLAGSSLRSDDQPISILLINWGCHRDLRRILHLGPLARVFVIDSHRPIHLHNLSSQNAQVVVLYTRNDEAIADVSYGVDVSELADAVDLDSDHEFGDEGDSDLDDDSDDTESDADEDEDGRRRKRRRRSEESDVDRKKREYYRLGSFHGKPSGCLMFDVSHSFRKNTNELLWLACVSLTDQFVHERLTNERYRDGADELENHINSSGNLDAVMSITLKDGTKIRAPDASRISYEEEPRLMLLREWTLFDSMLCSSYIATKLKTWSDSGLKRLKLALATMGFSLLDCQQKYQYMSSEVKDNMKGEFKRFLPQLGLEEVYYRSFVRLHGYGSKVSAADVVYGVTALLESFTESKDSSAEQFWFAYSALSLGNLDKLRKGMHSAIQIQRAILRQGSCAITKSGYIRSSRKFRWLKIEDAVDTKLLGYPQALTKFCYFLMDALLEKGAKMKPLICACLTPEPNKVLIVGIPGRPKFMQGNRFGNAFRAAAEQIEAEFFHELFESSWIILDRVAVNSFMIRVSEKL